MRRSQAVAVLAVLVAACQERTSPTQPISASDQHPIQTTVTAPSRGMLSRTAAPGLGAGGGLSAQVADGMQYHGGRILPVTNIVAMYWATSTVYSGGPAPGSSGAGNQDQSLVGFFLNHLGMSPYFNINTTYYDQYAGGHTVQNVVNYNHYWADNQNVPPANGSFVSDATIQAEIVRGFTTGQMTYDSSTIYAVFTAGNTDLGGLYQKSFCAYHDRFSWNGHIVIYAALPGATPSPLSCTSGLVPPNGDVAADAEASFIAHEVEESATDYNFDGWWFSGSGKENADACAWTWGNTYTTVTGGTANMNIAGRDFLVQQNWVNLPGVQCKQSLGHNGFYVASINGPANPLKTPGTYALSAGSLSVPASGPPSYQWTVTYSNGVLPKDSTPYQGSYQLQVPAGSYSISVTVTPTDVLGPGFGTTWFYNVCTNSGGGGVGNGVIVMPMNQIVVTPDKVFGC